MAGEVDPPLSVPVGDESVDRNDVLKESLTRRSASGHGRGAQHPRTDRGFERRHRLDCEAALDGDVGERLLGVGIEELTPQLAEYFGTKDGLLVTSVEPDTPAAKAGLKAGDVITSVNGKAVSSGGELIEAVQSAEDGAELTVGYVRDKKAATAKATLEAREKEKVERRVQPI